MVLYAGPYLGPKFQLRRTFLVCSNTIFDVIGSLYIFSDLENSEIFYFVLSHKLCYSEGRSSKYILLYEVEIRDKPL